MIKIKFLTAVISTLLLLASCGDHPYYEEYIEIPGGGWDADSSVAFEVEINDTASEYNIFLNLRHNDNYPYSNIYFFREIRSERGVEFRDTINFKMADPYGKWLGNGVGELKTLQWPFSSRSASFRKKGVYAFSITQAMREEKLRGIEDIGITIFKTQSENTGNGKEEKENK